MKDKIGLREVLNLDGRYSYSKISKIIAKIGDEKAMRDGLIPKIHSLNGKKRLFQLKDVEEWMKK